MTLSLNKLSKILKNNGFLPKKYFLLDNYCIYIEVYSLVNADNFLVYIPSKYDIKFENEGEHYNLQTLDMPENGDIPVEYAGKIDDKILEEYDDVELDMPLDTKNNSELEEKLNENYNLPISLKDMNVDDTNRIREIFRQLKRLKLCVQNINYKISILYKDYLCCLRRDNTFEAYLAKNLNGASDMKLMISIDMESLIKNIKSVPHDIKTVRESIYKILQKNQLKHIKVLDRMLSCKSLLSESFINIKSKQNRYTNYISKLEEMLKLVESHEEQMISKLDNINYTYSNSTNKGLQDDIERSHLVGKINDDLKNISVIKQEIIKNIILLKSKLENLSLHVDEICFDNIIMIDAITRNFETFSKF